MRICGLGPLNSWFLDQNAARGKCRGTKHGAWVLRYDCSHSTMTSEMLFIALLALLLFGPRRLPEMARQLGRFMADFRRASSEFQNQINEEIRKLDEEEKPAQSILPTASQPPGTEPMSLTGAINRLTDRIKSGSQEYDA